jgi:ElaB/YqjD/DUF883 family membrane-anchored ribosome-binding protein
MASPDEQLPEGTDTIIEGAGVSADDENESPARGASSTEEPPISAMPGAGEGKGVFFERMDELRSQAGDRARDLAQAGKDRATAALDSLVETVEQAAGDIDERLGSQYGDYARRAAEYIGNFSDSFRDKDIDDLFTDARELVKKSPAVAVGAAAVLGFVVARLARAGMPERSGDDAPKA